MSDEPWKFFGYTGNKFLHMPRQHSCRAMYKIL